MQRIKLKPYICYRYESRIMGGKAFIFNLESAKIYLSGFEAYKVLEFIDFNIPKVDELVRSFKEINIKEFITDMINKGVLEYEN